MATDWNTNTALCGPAKPSVAMEKNATSPTSSARKP